jgi:hypothetical protein
MADDQIIRPPDQVSAGGTPQAPDQGGIIDALRSRGAAPQAALANIMQPPMQANIGLAAGSGSLAAMPGGAGVGANPYLSGVNQQNKDQFYQQLNMQRLKDQQAERQMRLNEANLKVAEGLLESPDEDVRAAGANAKGRVMTQMGIPTTPEVLKGLAKKAVDPKQIESAARYLDLFGGDVKKSAELSGLYPAMVTELAKGKDSDAFSRIVYGKSKIERQREALDLKKTEMDIWAKEHPTSPEVASEASLVAQERFHKPLSELPDNDRVAATRLAEKNIKARDDQAKREDFSRKMELEKVKATLKQSGKDLESQQVVTLVGHGLVLIDKNGNQFNGDPLSRVGDAIQGGYEPVKIATAKEIQGGKYSFQIFSNMRAKAADLAQKGKLAAVGGIYEKAAQSSPDYAAARAGDPGAIERLSKYVQYNIGRFTKDPDIAQWAGMESEMVIALRGMGDKGIRALGAFQGAMDVMKNGQYDAIDGYIRNLETSSVTQFDDKYKGAFGTSYIVQDKKSGKTGRLKLTPGEALDLQKYRVMPEFNMPAKPSTE